jgi:hypothetical protein
MAKGLGIETMPVKPASAEEVQNLSSATDKKSDLYLKVVKEYREYIAECLDPTTWIDEFLLIFLPRILKRSVFVYSVDLHYWSEYPPLQPPTLDPIHLLLLGDHFAPLITNKALREKRWE